jgi:hypothetical protein
MNKKYPTFFLTWFRECPTRVPMPCHLIKVWNNNMYEHSVNTSTLPQDDRGQEISDLFKENFETTIEIICMGVA